MSVTNLKWKCKLSSFGFGEIASRNFSGGEGRVSIARSEEFYGLSRFFSTSLRFYKDLRTYVQRIYEEKGTEYEIVIKIYESVPEPVNKFELFFEGLIDLSTYINDQDQFVEADINESSFARKLLARKDIKVSIGETETIEGVVLPENNEVTVNLHQRELLSTGNYELNEAVATVQSILVIVQGTGLEGFTLPITLVGQDEGVNNLSSQDIPDLSTQGGAFWDPAGRESIGTFTGQVSGILRNAFVQSSNPTNVSFLLRIYTDDTLQFFTDLGLGANYVIPTDGSDVSFSFDIDGTIGGDPPAVNITAENVISLISINPEASSSGYKGYECEFTSIVFTAAQNLQWTDLTPAEGYLMFEVFKRNIQVTTDQETAFESELFGRPDIGYENLGEQALISFHSGSQIRQLPNSKPAISLSGLFKSMNSVLNLGLGIEYDSTGQPFVRVEKKAHFFNGTVIATLHNVSKMTKTVARKWIYSNIKYGYANSAPEELNGTEEYNNKQERATIIKSIKNELDLISLIRADGVGLEKLRRLSFETDPTTDAKEDNDNWIVDVLEDGANYKSAKDQAFDVVENIFSPESAYNLDKSPLRNLIRNGNVVRAGLEKNLDDLIKFMPTGVKDNMITKKPEEVLNVVENEDLNVLRLDAPLWIPEFYNCEFVLTRELYQAILRNQGGIIKLSTTDAEHTTNYNYGWINKIDYDPEKDLSTGEFLRVNLNNPDLELIDPDGNSPDVPPPIPPGPANYGGFEGAFPFVFAGDGDPETFYQALETDDIKLLETGSKKLLEDG